jgi:hypothetical protein
MSSVRVQHEFREADYRRRTRVSAAVTVAAGSVLVAAAAFVLSYGPIKKIVLAAGVPPALSALYPLMLDIMLVVTCVAALALRRAGWWTRAYAWLTSLILISAMAAADAARAASVSLPRRPTAATIAIAPWGLLLLGLALCLSMLGQRRTRAHAGAELECDPRNSEGGWGEEQLMLTRSPFEPLIPDSGPDGPAVRLLPPQPRPPARAPGPEDPAAAVLPRDAQA